MADDWQAEEDAYALRARQEMDSEARYVAWVDAVWSLQRSRVFAIIEAIADELTEAGYSVNRSKGDEFGDQGGDEYGYSIVVDGQELREPVDVTIELAESRTYGDGQSGANWGIDVVAYGGEMIGGLTPYNYTADCWTRNGKELARRLEMLDDAPSVVDLIDQWRQS